jgi:2-desacetyl-2-hydroxyethyl bacteriochlorophyllide A dehydrogenase
MRAETLAAQALWLAGPCLPELRTEQVPPPGEGEVRIRAVASAISQGTEMLVYRGQVPEDLPLDLPTLAGSFNFPIKYGYALVGHVIDCGTGVDHLAAGDAVFALHPHQEVALTPADLVVRLPDSLNPTLGVFTANLETALNVVHDAPLRLGEAVVVFGLGTVGLLIAQLLRLAGAGQVIGVDPIARRREIALALGVDLAMPPDEGLSERIRELTSGRGADIAIEVSGAASALQSAIDAVSVEGTVVVASWYGTKPVALTLGGHFHRGRVRLRSSQVGRIGPEQSARWDHQRRSETVAGLLPRLQLDPLVTHRVPFAEAGSAYRLVDEQPDEVVQVVFAY